MENYSRVSTAIPTGRLMGIKYGLRARLGAILRIFVGKRRKSWQPMKPRNARIQSVPVRSLQRSIAARSAKRWKKPRTWIANALTRFARAERNTQPTHDHRRGPAQAQLQHGITLRFGWSRSPSSPAGRIVRRNLRSERAAATPHETPGQSLRVGGNGVRTCCHSEGRA